MVDQKTQTSYINSKIPNNSTPGSDPGSAQRQAVKPKSGIMDTQVSAY